MGHQMKVLLSAAIVAALCLTGGCVSVSEAGYYWGNYSATLYAYQVSPSEETLAAHEQELMRLVEYADENAIKPPPGVLAELGYIEQKRGNNDVALGYYDREINTYPDSRLFLERLTSTLRSAEVQQ